MASWAEYRKTFYQEPPIFESIRAGDIEAVQSYLDEGGEIENRNFRGASLLMTAAYNNRLDICQLLIDRGADVNSEDAHGNSILMGAAFKGHCGIVQLLLKHGAVTGKRNPHGMTALEFARAFGRKDVIMLLSNESYSALAGARAFAKMITQTLRPW